MNVTDISRSLLPFVAVGFTLGCVPWAAGLGVQMLINVMKRF